MQKNIIISIVSFAMFMEAVDTTVINTAIPVMAKSLNVNPIDLKLALISYLLSLAIFIPISGWVGDKFGIKKVFMFALTTFTLSSIWCGFTNSLYQLITARIIQGLGGSLMTPIGRLILLRTCERHELITKMSIVIMVASMGMMLGPFLGGIITDYFSWRWIFWVNVPVGALALLLAFTLLPDMPKRDVPPLDKWGFVLFGSGLAALTLGLSTFSESKVSISQSSAIIAAAFVLLLAYWKHSYNRPHPIVNVDLLKHRAFRVSMTGNILARLSFGGMPFLLPLLLQIGLGFSPQTSGLLMTPLALGVFFSKSLTLRILRALGYKKLLLLNTTLVGLSLWLFMLVKPGLAMIIIVCLTFLYGFLIATQYTGMNSLAYSNLDDHQISSATSILSTIQQLAQSFGVAISAIFLSIFTYEFSATRALTVQTFHQTFFMLGVLTLLSGFIFTTLKPHDGQELIK